MQVKLIVLETFFRGGKLHHPNQQITVGERVANELIKLNLVKKIEPIEPIKEVDKKKENGFVSQAEPASVKETVKKSKRGKPKTQKKEG